MRFLKLVLAMLVFSVQSSAVFAQESGLWEKAFARPHGAILVSEIMYEPQKFLVAHSGEEITIAGKFYNPNLSRDGSKTYAGIVWGGRYTGAACVSTDKQEIIKVVDLVPGSEVLATGTVTKYDDGWLHLEECTINDGVTLFHSRDPRFILGAWCGVADGRTFRMVVFSRSDKGGYLQRVYDVDNRGKWQAWSASATPSRVKRKSTKHIETAFIGRTADYNRDRYTIVSNNQMSTSSGSQFYRCK